MISSTDRILLAIAILWPPMFLIFYKGIQEDLQEIRKLLVTLGKAPK